MTPDDRAAIKALAAQFDAAPLYWSDDDNTEVGDNVTAGPFVVGTVVDLASAGDDMVGGVVTFEIIVPRGSGMTETRKIMHGLRGLFGQTRVAGGNTWAGQPDFGKPTEDGERYVSSFHVVLALY